VVDGWLGVISAIAAVVPAANEEGGIGACLASLASARAHLRRSVPQHVSVRVVVVLDGCVDRTETIAGTHLGTELVRCGARQVGVARASGAAYVLRTSGARSFELWLANTDADSTVPTDWLTTMFEEARRGVHLVLGTVAPQTGLDAVTERRWLRRHPLRENHPHVHGANFGIRADTYRALGGWPGVPSGEDVALVARATADAGVRIVRTARIPVRTSPRLVGRAPRGFSSYLRRLTLDDAAVR
jgi:glycosyltransferase involved in cell wall biosynthesis